MVGSPINIHVRVNGKYVLTRTATNNGFIKRRFGQGGKFRKSVEGLQSRREEKIEKPPQGAPCQMGGQGMGGGSLKKGDQGEARHTVYQSRSRSPVNEYQLGRVWKRESKAVRTFASGAKRGRGV